MISIKVLLTLALLEFLFGVKISEGRNEVTEAKQPPNEWGCYYSLPNKTDIMQRAFQAASEEYFSRADKETTCKTNDAEFERWFVSSKNPNHYILSYYCRTKDVRGYEHLKVEMNGDNFVRVLDFKTSLKKFGIMDAGDYGEGMNSKEGVKVMNNLLPNLIAQIAQQKNPFNKNVEMCPTPLTNVFTDVSTKKENGLTYYKMPISCNVSDAYGYGADFMTTIEVAVDTEYKVLNNGNPVLVSMESPTKNIDYIKERDRLAAKQKNDCFTVSPIVTLVVLCVLSRLV